MFDLAGNFRVVRCQSCGLVCLFPMPDERRLAHHYPSARYYAYDSRRKEGFFSRVRNYLVRHYYHPNLATRLLRVVIPNVPAIPTFVSRGNILDVGCGTGDTLLLLKELGWETFGMDIDANAVTTAKKRGVDHVRVGAYQDIAKYPDNFFDSIRLYHVIEHIDNPLLCLKLMRRKLKKGGELIIGTPNIASLAARVFGTFWYNLDAPRHLVLFSQKTLRRAVLKSKYTQPEVEFCSAGGLIGSVQYMLKEKFGIAWNLIHNPWLIVLAYPFEWIIDKLRMGDVFVFRARK